MKCLHYQYIILITMLVTAQVVSAGPSEKAEQVRAALTEIIDQHRSGSIDSRQLKKLNTLIISADPQLVLDELSPFERHADPDARREAMYLAAQIGHQTPPASKIRQEVVERLVKAMNDSDISFNAYGKLRGFRAADFSEQAMSRLRQRLRPKYPYTDIETIMIFGVANMQDQISMLKRVRMRPKSFALLSLAERESFYGTAGWKARLALARMGSQEDIEYCITMVEAYPDVETRVVRLLDDLAYIRQPEAIRTIQKYLESDGRIDPQGDVVPLPYWDYVITILGKILDDFPVEADYAYSLEDRDTARAWMKAQTEFTIKR